MIEYKFDTQETYIKEILAHLEEFEKPFIGETEKEAYSFYAIENGNLVGALNVFCNWDWVMILNLYYDNVLVLNDMIYELCQRYKQKANGVHFRTYDKDRLQDFIKLGFTHCATINSKTDHNDLYMADLMNLGTEHTPTYEVISHNEQNEIYQQILEENAKQDLAKIKSPQLLEEVTIVALDEGIFAGGVVAKANEDSFHIDLLVVTSEYRGRNIGKKLMGLAEEEAQKRGILTMDLSTSEFQAKPFYEKLGYQVVYTRPHYPSGFKNYKLIKQIDKK